MNADSTREKRLNGLVVVDKPPTMTSAALTGRVKYLFGAAKAGHTGTLDPFASGVMICLLNRATRLADFFLHEEKTYRATLRLGIETDTQDLTGKVTRTRPVRPGDLSATEIERACWSFAGESKQVPPVYSALKHKGKPLYQLARQGAAIKKPARRINIYSIVVEDIALPRVTIRVTCSGGTYIRTLGADIGTSLGFGAHVTALRRVKAGGLPIEEAVSLPALEESAEEGTIANSLMPMSAGLKQMPAYQADPDLARKIRHGQSLSVGNLERVPATDHQHRFKMMDERGGLLAIMQKEKNHLRYCCVFPD